MKGMIQHPNHDDSRYPKKEMVDGVLALSVAVADDGDKNGRRTGTSMSIGILTI